MATKKAEYFKFNQDGNVWDLYYFRTSADLIVETDEKKVLTKGERTKISDFLTTFNTANELVQVDSGGKIPTSVIPTLPYLSTSGGTVNGGLKVKGIAEFQSNAVFHDTYLNGTIYNDAGIITFGVDAIDFGGALLSNIATPIQQTDATTKEYVDNKVSSGFTTKEPVKCASVASINITEVLNSLDGYALSANDRILLKNQTTASQNGVYKLDSSKKPVKVADDSAVGSAVFIENGNTNNDYIYHCSTENTWVAFTKPDTVKAGVGLSKSGTTLSIANEGITNAMLKNDSITTNKLAEISLTNQYEEDAHWGPPFTETNLTIQDLIGRIIGSIKLMRGTEDAHTVNSQTIAGAYTSISTVQTNLNTAIGTIPKITSGTSNPSTTGAKNGDLYFKELS